MAAGRYGERKRRRGTSGYVSKVCESGAGTRRKRKQQQQAAACTGTRTCLARQRCATFSLSKQRGRPLVEHMYFPSRSRSHSFEALAKTRAAISCIMLTPPRPLQGAIRVRPLTARVCSGSCSPPTHLKSPDLTTAHARPQGPRQSDSSAGVFAAIAWAPLNPHTSAPSLTASFKTQPTSPPAHTRSANERLIPHPGQPCSGPACPTTALLAPPSNSSCRRAGAPQRTARGLRRLSHLPAVPATRNER